MARIFITGSTDGLGLLASQELVSQGHQVVMHARNEKRKADALKMVSGVEAIVLADLSDIKQIRELASQVNALGTFDAVIHNAGVYTASPKDIFTVNVLAPYLLTCLIKKPKRIVYVSSDMHLSGQTRIDNGGIDINHISYSDSKLLLMLMCKAIAHRWADVYVNALHPGWVPTKMGGKGAPDNLQKGFETQVWLSVSDHQDAKVSGCYFFHQKQSRYHAAADDSALQNRLMKVCQEMTKTDLPH